MDKRAKRTKAQSSSKRAVTPTTKRTASAEGGKSLLPEVKSVAKKAALAAGVAAVGTAAALSALKSEQKTAEQDGSDQDEFKGRSTSEP